MNITKEPNGNLQSVIHIHISEEDYQKNVTDALKAYRKKANMPGFRPGMVPMGLIKKMYGSSVLLDEVNKLVSESLDKYIANEKLELLGHPIANMEKSKQINFDTDKEFDFYFDIAEAPEIDIDLNAIGKIPYYKIIAGDKEIDVAIKDATTRYAEKTNPEKIAENDNISGIFTQVDKNGNVLEDGITVNGIFKVNDLKLKKYQKEFIGKKVGDTVILNVKKAFDKKDIEIIFGKEITEEQIASDYKFEIKEITRYIPPELNEDLFKKIYPDDDIKTEEDFRKRLKEDMEQQYAKESDRKFVDDVVDKLVKTFKMDLPEEFLKRWVLESNQGQITKEQLETQWDSYVKTLKWQVIEEKLSKKYDNVTVSNEDIRNKVRAYFGIKDKKSSNDQVEQIVDQVLSNSQEQNRIYNDLKSEKLAVVFNEHVDKDEKEVTVDEFINILSPEPKEEEKEEEKENKA